MRRRKRRRSVSRRITGGPVGVGDIEGDIEGSAFIVSVFGLFGGDD